LSQAAQAEPVLLPEILGERVDGDGVVLNLRVPEALAYLVGHFREIPVVPGVVQIHWAIQLARPRLKIDGPFSHMEAVKFKEILMPSQRVDLSLRYLEEGRKLEFYYRSETAEYGSGRIYFHDNPI